MSGAIGRRFQRSGKRTHGDTSGRQRHGRTTREAANVQRPRSTAEAMKRRGRARWPGCRPRWEGRSRSRTRDGGCPAARSPSLAAIPTPTCTCVSLPRRPRTCKGALPRVPDGQTLAKRGPGAARRPQVRRGGDAAELAIHSRGRRRLTGRRFAVRSSAFMNGSGCAAASI